MRETDANPPSESPSSSSSSAMLHRKSCGKSSIEALKKGSYQAFTDLYNLYVDRLYSFVIAQTKNRTVAQDIVQDTFMKLWNNRKALDVDGNVKALLFTMARHQTIDTFRRQVLEVGFEDYMNFCQAHPEAPSAEEKLYYDDFLKRFQQSKARLSKRERQIYEMRRERNLTIDQIAEALGLSPQTVKNHLTSVSKSLRNSLLDESLVALFTIMMIRLHP